MKGQRSREIKLKVRIPESPDRKLLLFTFNTEVSIAIQTP